MGVIFGQRSGACAAHDFDDERIVQRCVEAVDPSTWDSAPC